MRIKLLKNGIELTAEITQKEVQMLFNSALKISAGAERAVDDALDALDMVLRRFKDDEKLRKEHAELPQGD